MNWTDLLLVGLTFLLLGYAGGRRFGLRQGEKRGEALAALLLKEEALARGSCPLCGCTVKSSVPPAESPVPSAREAPEPELLEP